MNDRTFLDTNILVYLYDNDAPEKQAAARALLEQASEARMDLVISTQVLQEFYVTVVRKFSRSLSDGEVLLAMRRFLAFPVVQVDIAMIFDAIELGRRFKISFWDALIARTALAAGCSRLLSEDFQHQMRIGDLTVENPFVTF